MRGLIEHACATCGDTAALLDATAGWVCPSCTQTADTESQPETLRLANGFEIESAGNGFFLNYKDDVVAYIHPMEICDIELKRRDGAEKKIIRAVIDDWLGLAATRHGRHA